MSKIDWQNTRALKWARDEPPTDWPRQVRPISINGLCLFGIDKDNQLYWDGNLVETKRVLKLSKMQVLGAFVVGLFAIIGAIGSAAQGWAVYNEWACRAGYPAVACQSATK